MESQPQNRELWNNPENFHPCVQVIKCIRIGTFVFKNFIWGGIMLFTQMQITFYGYHIALNLNL